MNGIEKITARIRADAEAECAAIRAESEERCAAIRAENERAAQEEYWRLVREGVKDTEQRVQRLGRTARLEAKKSVLSMKQRPFPAPLSWRGRSWPACRSRTTSPSSPVRPPRPR